MSDKEVPIGVKPGAAAEADKVSDLKRSPPQLPGDSRTNSDTGTLAPDLDEAEGWVDRYGETLYRFALARVKDPVAAEDLVQEIFLAALRGREKFQGRASLKSWLVAILKHKIVDHFRRNVREMVLENFDSLADQAAQDFGMKLPRLS